MERKCPLCGNTYHAKPALSRTDNKTLICPVCGIRQALEVSNVKKDVRDEIVHLIKQSYSEG